MESVLLCSHLSQDLSRSPFTRSLPARQGTSKPARNPFCLLFTPSRYRPPAHSRFFPFSSTYYSHFVLCHDFMQNKHLESECSFMCKQVIYSSALDLSAALQLAHATGALSQLLTVKIFQQCVSIKRFTSANITQQHIPVFQRRKQLLLRL